MASNKQVHARVRERDVKAAILKSCVGATAFRLWPNATGFGYNPDGSAVVYGFKGAADYTGIFTGSGRRLEVEFKSPTGKLSSDQERFGGMIRAAGGVYIVARSVEQFWEAINAEIA